MKNSKDFDIFSVYRLLIVIIQNILLEQFGEFLIQSGRGIRPVEATATGRSVYSRRCWCYLLPGFAGRDKK